MANLLVEIGVEELPVSAIDLVLAELQPKAEEHFRAKRLGFEKVFVGATPRRIALFVEGVEARQQDQELEFSGPSVEKAYNQGQPTPALEGFLKSKGASLKDVTVKETPKGKFVMVQRKEKGGPAASILPVLLQEIFAALSFPKNMRWEKTNFRYPRPIRWIVALLDSKVIPFQLADVKAGKRTYGHRFLAPKALNILKADWKAYQKTLKRAHAILSLEERKEIIRKALKGKFGQAHFDEELLHTDANLVEEPFLLSGSFSKSYLELPAEVLASCMKKNQKIFACYDPRGRLSGKFLAVLNGARKAPGGIREGYENVLESRLKDAQYFFKADTQEPLEKKLPLLEQVAYLGKLGNLLEKTQRLEKLAERFASLAGREDLKVDLKRAVRLAKIDLMTHLVYEFPDLQGIVGREYALAAGEKESVAQAIGSQYLPKNLAEDYRELFKQMNPLGAMVGILDRLDLLVGAFGIGLEPSGSQDPYALRRAGGSIVKLVRAFGFHFSIREAVGESLKLYGSVLSQNPDQVKTRLIKFFEDRIIAELQVKAGTRPYEILQAVLRTGSDDFADVFERFQMLAQLYETDPDAFLKAAKVVERTANIIKGTKVSGAPDPGVLKEPSERRLYELLSSKSAEIEDFLKKRDYRKATSQFGEIFYLPLHDFFEQVMVNVEDPAIRQSRQALMSRINRLYTERLADLSVLSRLDQG